MKRKWISAALVVLFAAALELECAQETGSAKLAAREKITHKVNQAAQEQSEQMHQIQEEGQEAAIYAGVTEILYEELEGIDPDTVDAAAMLDQQTLTDDEVYSYLQGPKSWEEQRDWSGEWCNYYVKGNSFGGFGCGLCCMANIYSTLSDYECSPLAMFQQATTVTNYYPSRESGAIGWEDMQATLSACGVSSKRKRKPDSYDKFRRQMEENPTMIVLVSSNYDDTFWKNTGGHYVNIWNYKEEDDTVFLAEPGDPENNRTRIPLKYVYDALKEISDYQYLLVKEYAEEGNSWKQNGITDNWVRPAQ